MEALTTARLDVVPATLAHLVAELESATALGRLLGAAIPAGWPPGEYDRGAIEFFHGQLAANPQLAGWLGWYAVWRADANRVATVVGAGGFFGCPTRDGQVEIGYSIVPDYCGRGFATELTRALVVSAQAVPGVRTIIAHASPLNIGSVRVLERCGFRVSGPGTEAGTQH